MTKSAKPKISKVTAIRDAHVAYCRPSATEALHSETKDTLAGKPRILLFARACYSEEEVWLPITNVLELKRFLWKKYPAGQGYFHLIGPQKDARRQVQLFQLNVPVPEYSALWVPESWLLGESLSNNQTAEFNTPDGPLFIARTAAGKLVSGKPSALIPNAKRFAWSAGLAGDIEPAEFTLPQTRAALSGRLNRFVVKHGLQLVQWVGRQSIQVNTRAIAAMLALVLPLYFVLTSGYLMVKEWQLQSAIEAKQANVEQALNAQQQVASLTQSNEQMQAVLAQKNDQARFWQLLLTVEDEYNADIEKVSWDQQGIEISGRTRANPTKILEVISQHPDIANAEFSSPIRRRGAFANYRIRANLNSGDDS
ncbi:hypothetical protein LG288_02540 [Idiomarina seosinensis]|uniref:hypothetical protein n=1 Tax=Idiomarina seosinensis TaxID=281739 RepID=UPI00384AE386